MSKNFKVVGIVFLMIFSFYYTDKIALYVQNNTPLKKEIMVFKDKNVVPSINAELKDNGIIPGVNGLKVDVDKSYKKMKATNVFNKQKIIYEEVKPEISIMENTDKIIIGGNKAKNSLSIIINSDSNIGNILTEYGIKYDYIGKTNYCILVNNNCENDKRLKVKPTIIMNNTNFIKYIGTIDRGDIIYINDNLDEIYIDILKKHIRYYNIKSLSLYEHLSENNHL